MSPTRSVVDETERNEPLLSFSFFYLLCSKRVFARNVECSM